MSKTELWHLAAGSKIASDLISCLSFLSFSFLYFLPRPLWQCHCVTNQYNRNTFIKFNVRNSNQSNLPFCRRLKYLPKKFPATRRSSCRRREHVMAFGNLNTFGNTIRNKSHQFSKVFRFVSFFFLGNGAHKQHRIVSGTCGFGVTGISSRKAPILKHSFLQMEIGKGAR